ncbi:MAG: nitroreductase family protein [Candidatus Muiribacteriota bacterium]
MKKLMINYKKCKSCFQCARVCPANFKKYKNRVKPVYNNCIKCGHCIMACPGNAINNNLINKRNFSEFNNSFLKPDKIDEFLGSKRSVRYFKKDEIPYNIFYDIIKTKYLAPSATNRRVSKIKIIKDKNTINEIEKISHSFFKKLKLVFNPLSLKMLKKLKPDKYKPFYNYYRNLKRFNSKLNTQQTPVFRNAPYVIVHYSDKFEPMGVHDCNADQQYLMMKAHSHGVGSCIIGLALPSKRKIAKKLKLKNKTIHCFTIMGYPEVKFYKRKKI